jgi:hypothetical protein
VQLLYEFAGKAQSKNAGSKALEQKFKERAVEIRKQPKSRIAAGLPVEAVVKTISVAFATIEYEYWGESFSYSTIGMFMLGGNYRGYLRYLRWGNHRAIPRDRVSSPVYTIAEVALTGTFITFVARVTFCSLAPVAAGFSTTTDWTLGFLFGAGGFVGIYLGARFQKFVPQR